MPFGLVQSASVSTSGAGFDETVTLPSAAAAGNLLVVVLGHRRSDAAALPVISGAGSTGLTREFAYTDNTGGNKGVALFWKEAAGGETTFTATEAQQWRYLQVFEFSRPAGDLSFVGFDTATNNAAATGLTVSVADPSSSDSLAAAATFGRDSQVDAVTFDSGFGATLQETELHAAWVDDATTVAGGTVTATYPSARIAIAGVGVWAVAGAGLAAPSNVTFEASRLDLDAAWAAVGDAETYGWEVEEDDGGSWVAFDSGVTAATSLRLSFADGVKWGTKYRFRVLSSSSSLPDSSWSYWVQTETQVGPEWALPVGSGWVGAKLVAFS